MFHFRKFKIINLYCWLTIILILIDFFPSTLWYLIILVDGRRLLSQSSSSNSMLSKIIISNRSKRSRSFNDFDDSEYFSKQKWIHFLQDPKDLQPSHTERSNDYYSERSDYGYSHQPVKSIHIHSPQPYYQDKSSKDSLLLPLLLLGILHLAVLLPLLASNYD
ncbi:DNA topoisomerase 1-like [Sarcoptes scabiei]|nr:DNA topoisomerase 1-like [Sarcoptes scabiei]